MINYIDNRATKKEVIINKKKVLIKRTIKAYAINGAKFDAYIIM